MSPAPGVILLLLLLLLIIFLILIFILLFLLGQKRHAPAQGRGLSMLKPRTEDVRRLQEGRGEITRKSLQLAQWRGQCQLPEPRWAAKPINFTEAICRARYIPCRSTDSLAENPR